MYGKWGLGTCGDEGFVQCGCPQQTKLNGTHLKMSGHIDHINSTAKAHTFVRQRGKRTYFVHSSPRIAIEFNAGPLLNETTNDSSTNIMQTFPSFRLIAWHVSIDVATLHLMQISSEIFEAGQLPIAVNNRERQTKIDRSYCISAIPVGNASPSCPNRIGYHTFFAINWIPLAVNAESHRNSFTEKSEHHHGSDNGILHRSEWFVLQLFSCSVRSLTVFFQLADRHRVIGLKNDPRKHLLSICLRKSFIVYRILSFLRHRKNGRSYFILIKNIFEK